MARKKKESTSVVHNGTNKLLKFVFIYILNLPEDDDDDDDDDDDNEQ